MGTESRTTPRPLSGCTHRWKCVEGATSAKGGRVLFCELCNATREPDPPVVEQRDSKPPLLME